MGQRGLGASYFKQRCRRGDHSHDSLKISFQRLSPDSNACVRSCSLISVLVLTLKSTGDTCRCGEQPARPTEQPPGLRKCRGSREITALPAVILHRCSVQPCCHSNTCGVAEITDYETRKKKKKNQRLLIRIYSSSPKAPY